MNSGLISRLYSYRLVVCSSEPCLARGYHSITPVLPVNTHPKHLHALQALVLPLPVPAGLPLFFPAAAAGCARAAAGCPSARLPSAALMSSSSFSSIACSCSLRRPRSNTSSGLIVLRPACLEKTSKSRAVFAITMLAQVLQAREDNTYLFACKLTR